MTFWFFFVKEKEQQEIVRYTTKLSDDISLVKSNDTDIPTRHYPALNKATPTALALVVPPYLSLEKGRQDQKEK